MLYPIGTCISMKCYANEKDGNFTETYVKDCKKDEYCSVSSTSVVLISTIYILNVNINIYI